MHDIDDVDPHTLPISTLMNVFLNLGLLEGEGSDIVGDSYERYGSHVVGGSFTSPNFMYDKDDGGNDDSEEFWLVDSFSGTYLAEPQRIPFTCSLPNAAAGTQPPYDVAIFGHGYGSSRLEALTFGWAFNQVGYAYCFMDFHGHGPNISPDEEELVLTVVENIGLSPFIEHLLDARYRDLNNDGVNDSGGDQWSADVFHSRDMVRQGVVDWIQLVRSLKDCGNGNMVRSDGTEGLSCDWDNDGKIDLGGPDAKYYISGGSLGGIVSGVAASVMPEVTAFAPIAGGANLLDMAVRTEIGGAIEAMHGRLMTPLFLGYPAEDGSLDIVQMVNSETNMRTLPVQRIDSFPANGKVVVENLSNGETKMGWIPPDGRFRVGIAADALNPAEKRMATNMPTTGPEEGQVYMVEGNEGLGDRFRITIYDEQEQVLHTIDSWEQDIFHEGITMKAGSPLVAGSYGTGRIRGSSNLRRIASVFGMAMEGGDPIAYASHYFLEPFEELGGKPANVLLMPTAGDTIVPVSTGITHARVAGLIDQDTIDERYGMTVDEWLIDKKVIQGLEQHGPYTDVEGNPCLFDADDLDGGLDGTGAPSEEPLRLSTETSSGVVGLRIPYIETTGSHAFIFPSIDKPYDQASFGLNSIAYFFLREGKEISDDLCMGTYTCDWLPELDVNTQQEEE